MTVCPACGAASEPFVEEEGVWSCALCGAHNPPAHEGAAWQTVPDPAWGPTQPLWNPEATEAFRPVPDGWQHSPPFEPVPDTPLPPSGSKRPGAGKAGKVVAFSVIAVCVLFVAALFAALGGVISIDGFPEGDPGGGGAGGGGGGGGGATPSSVRWQVTGTMRFSMTKDVTACGASCTGYSTSETISGVLRFSTVTGHDQRTHGGTLIEGRVAVPMTISYRCQYAYEKGGGGSGGFDDGQLPDVPVVANYVPANLIQQDYTGAPGVAVMVASHDYHFFGHQQECDGRTSGASNAAQWLTGSVFGLGDGPLADHSPDASALFKPGHHSIPFQGDWRLDRDLGVVETGHYSGTWEMDITVLP